MAVWCRACDNSSLRLYIVLLLASQYLGTLRIHRSQVSRFITLECMSVCLSVSTAVPCHDVRLPLAFFQSPSPFRSRSVFVAVVCMFKRVRLCCALHCPYSVVRACETWSNNNRTRSSCRSHSVLLFRWCALQHCFDCVRSLFCLLPIESSVDVRRDRTYIQVICERVLLTQFWCVYLHCEDIDNHKSNQIVRVDLIRILFQKKINKFKKKNKLKLLK